MLRNNNTSYAGFGQLSYEVVPGLTITVGGRETKDTKQTRLLQASRNALGVDTYGGRRYVRLSDSKPSWDGSILWQATPDLSVYARVAKRLPRPDHPGPFGGVQRRLHHRELRDQHQL